jgi:hypothetical protein
MYGILEYQLMIYYSLSSSYLIGQQEVPGLCQFTLQEDQANVVLNVGQKSEAVKQPQSVIYTQRHKAGLSPISTV